MSNQIKFWMLCFMCLMILTGCRGKEKINDSAADSTAMPTASSSEETEEEQPFTLPFGENVGIDLPNVDAGEWDEDEETNPVEESIQEYQKPSADGNNDLPAVPGIGWDEDPNAELTTPPTDTTTPPASNAAGNEGNHTIDNTESGATEPEQTNPTDVLDATPGTTEEPDNNENQLPGLPDIGWD